MNDLLYDTKTENEDSVTNSNGVANKRSDMIAHRLRKYQEQRNTVGQCIPSIRYSTAREMYTSVSSVKEKPQIVSNSVFIDEIRNLNELPDLKPSVIVLKV